MAKQGEIDYLKNLGPDGVQHAALKPFSDPGRARYLAELGALLALLPPPPARLLDLGCGTGWTSVFFARSGYDVLGVDLAPDMIALARQQRNREGLSRLDFVACDYEDLPFEGGFDAVVYFDALHHAVDEAAALRCAYQALDRGGVCVASEPGAGHHESPEAVAAVQRFGVTEKEMPPEHVVALGRQIGFRSWRVLPHAYDLHAPLYHVREDAAAPAHRTPPGLKRLLFAPLLWALGVRPGVFSDRMGAFYYLKQVIYLLRAAPRAGGIVVLTK